MRRRIYDTPAWQAVRAAILERDHGRCQIAAHKCTVAATDVDHIVPLADGGAPYDPANLRAACKWCNSWAAAQRTNAMRRQAAASRRVW